MVALFAAWFSIVPSGFPHSHQGGLAHDFPTYSRHIAPVFRAKCTPCHSKGQSAPFSLDSYGQVLKNLGLVRIKVMSGGMPPCIGESDFGPLSLQTKLTDSQVVRFQEWLRGGAKQGKADSDPPPQPSKVAWRLGKPDRILDVVPKSGVRLEGTRYWMAYEVPLAQSGELVAFDVIPASSQALQNVVLGFSSSRSVHAKEREVPATLYLDGDHLIGAWAPGYRKFSLPPDTSMVLPRSARLLVQAHYQPLGMKAPAGMKIGLYFVKTPRKKRANWATMSSDAFEIPANDDREQVLNMPAPRQGSLLAILPEARFYCSVVQVSAVRRTDAGLSSRLLFLTRSWTPYWIGNFAFEHPVPLLPGERFEARFRYNNDPRCPANEGRVPEKVTSGKTLSDEMCRLHILIAR